MFFIVLMDKKVCSKIDINQELIGGAVEIGERWGSNYGENVATSSNCEK